MLDGVIVLLDNLTITMLCVRDFQCELFLDYNPDAGEILVSGFLCQSAVALLRSSKQHTGEPTLTIPGIVRWPEAPPLRCQ